MKVLVMGTSHVGCIRMASKWTKAAFPTLDVTYFALPSIMYANALMIGSCFGPTKANKKDCLASLERNGSEYIDLAPFDQIFHVGERLAMSPVDRFMADTDILELSERGDRSLITLRAAKALIEASVVEYAEERHSLFGDDPRITFTPAPYPLARSAEIGRGQERVWAQLNTRKTAQDWSHILDHIMEKTLEMFGYKFMPQPMETRHGIFTTDNRYARPRGAIQKRGGDVDNRHMNTAFGQNIFAAFARTQLGLRPVSAPDLQH
jgi:hypothetical protein